MRRSSASRTIANNRLPPRDAATIIAVRAVGLKLDDVFVPAAAASALEVADADASGPEAADALGSVDVPAGGLDDGAVDGSAGDGDGSGDTAGALDMNGFGLLDLLRVWLRVRGGVMLTVAEREAVKDDDWLRADVREPDCDEPNDFDADNDKGRRERERVTEAFCNMRKAAEGSESESGAAPLSAYMYQIAACTRSFDMSSV